MSRGRVNVEERAEPTPETQAKLREDPVLWLRVNHPNLFAAEHEMAGKEIEACVRMLAHQVMVLAQDMNRIGHGMPREFTDFEAKVLGIYANWQEEIRRRRIPFWAVYDVVVEGKRPIEAAADHRMDGVVVLHWLHEALTEYGIMRGWIERG
jgi:hypothetical protein